MMRFDQLSKKDQARFRKRFNEATQEAMKKYTSAPSWMKSINPLMAAIVDGDFDRYSELLDTVTDTVLDREIAAPGTGLEFQLEDFYYENF